jgi:hypothetical protein
MDVDIWRPSGGRHPLVPPTLGLQMSSLLASMAVDELGLLRLPEMALGCRGRGVGRTVGSLNSESGRSSRK